MAEIFTEEILMMLFEETGEDFGEWAGQYDYANMSDKDIYAALPDEILAVLSDFDINASWMHHGM